MANSGDMARVLALQADMRALQDRLSTLEGQIGGVAETLEELASRQKQSKPAPAAWPVMGETEFGERWPQLLGWLSDVLAARYPADTRRLTPCWAQHPATVDALTALWLTWLAAHLNRAADARDAAAWHVQWRPQLVDAAAAPLADCRRSNTGHVDPVDLPADLTASFR